ncbi:MAG: GNAT family N-acetyltransferase [Pseudomonadota bacterium]
MSMTLSIAETPEELEGVADLTRQYLEWDLRAFEKAAGLSLDLEAYVANTLDHLDAYMPPDGRLVMARDAAGRLQGLVLLRRLDPESAEIKRLFVDPAARGKGVGERLVETVLDEAGKAGYRRVFLDTATYMTAAHRLYRRFGFRDTAPYPGSENDETVKAFLIFMTREL